MEQAAMDTGMAQLQAGQRTFPSFSLHLCEPGVAHSWLPLVTDTQREILIYNMKA